MGDKRNTGLQVSMNSETTNSGNNPFLVDSFISVDGRTQYHLSSPRWQEKVAIVQRNCKHQISVNGPQLCKDLPESLGGNMFETTFTSEGKKVAEPTSKKVHLLCKSTKFTSQN